MSSTRPSASSRPRPMIDTVSATCCTSARMWLETSTVFPWCASRRMVCPDLVDAGRVEPVGRLVEDQQVRILEQGRRDRQALLHARASSRYRSRPVRRDRPPPAPAPTRCRGAPMPGGQQRPGSCGRRSWGRTSAARRSLRPGRPPRAAGRAPRCRTPRSGRHRRGSGPSSIRMVVVLPDPFGPEEAVHPTGRDLQVEPVDGRGPAPAGVGTSCAARGAQRPRRRRSDTSPLTSLIGHAARQSAVSLRGSRPCQRVGRRRRRRPRP